MSFSGRNDEVVYIIVSIKINVGKDMGSCRYYSDVLDHNTGIWWICDNEKMTDFRGYLDNVYDGLLHEKGKNRGKEIL